MAVLVPLLALTLSWAPPDLPPVDEEPPAGDDAELEDNPEWDEEDAAQPAPTPAPDPDANEREDDDAAGAGGATAPVVAPAPAPSPTPSPSPSPSPSPAPETQTPKAQRPGGGGGAGGSGAQKPSAKPQSQPAAEGPAKSPPSSRGSAPPAEKDWDGKPRDEKEAEEDAEEEKEKGKFGGLKLFRIAVYPKIGYTHGTSDKNGIFDRQKSIDASIENMEATMKGAGDLGTTKFGGFMGGFEVDLEVFFINAWLDFHKFFRPGGMWSLLIGYDHEFDFHKRVRFNLGAGFGMMRVFLGQALADLYYDSSNPQAVNIATAGIEGRLMTGFDFRIAGPLWTGPQFMGGYHYLFSANVDEVTKEKGFHYSAAWNLKLHFEFPRDW